MTMKQFIETAVEKRINGYRRENPLIDSEYARENELGKSYKGREILELIQNAEDELTEEMPKEIYIFFDGEQLSIANYGEPFTEEGILSLMYSNTSNKKKRKKRVIGNKGTGFRAILGWADEIRIDSADLHIKFSDKHAQEILKNEVFKGKKLPKEKKAATLVFPEWIEDAKKSKYTTVISLSVRHKKEIVEDIREQLSNLNGNLLLFLNHTQKLTVNIEGEEFSFEKHLVEADRIKLIKRISDNEIYSKEWFINKKEGTIGEENYSIVIAYDNEENMPENPYIYTYFQTDVKFPFPVLLHADFNLNSDRNHLLKNDSCNKIILENVATLLIETAIKIYAKGTSYNRIKFLLPREELEIELEKYKFLEILHEKMKEAEIFPTVNSKYVSYDENLKFYESGLAKHLFGKDFSDLLMYSDSYDVDYFLNNLPCIKYSYSEIVPKMKRWVEGRNTSNTNIRKVAYTAIQFLNEYGDDGEFEMYPDQRPSFFYNLEKKLIPSGKSTFLVDENYDVTKPPIFANVEFLNPYMRNYFYKQLKEDDKDNDTDVILEKLGAYNVREYNSEELIEHINGVLFEKIQTEGMKKAKNRWKTLIKWLWTNKNLLIDEEVSISMLFLNREGKLVESNSLYYGIEYGNNIIEDLIGDICPQYMTCNLRQYVECDNENELVEFLRLFGISDLPRMEIVKRTIYTNNNHDEYIKNVLADLQYPVTLDNRYVFDSLTNFCDRISQVDIKRTEIPLLGEILQKSKTSAIIKWIRVDDKLQNHLYTGHEGSAPQVEVVWDDLRTPRPLLTLKRPYSYIYHLFANEHWIQVGEKRYAISDCLIGFDSHGINLSDYLVEPDIAEYINGIEGAKGKLRKEFQTIFEKMQVKRDFADLPLKKIYSVLNYLPTVEGSEEVAKSFYNSLIDKIDAEYTDAEFSCEEYEEYITSGKILTNNGFQPVNECYYLDGKDICEKVARNYNLICIPKKRSKKRIKRMLGVERLILVGKIVGQPQIHLENNLFNSDFNQFKIMAFTYRMNSVTNLHEEAKKFNDINIKICTMVKAAYRAENEQQSQEIYLDDYEYILDGASTYYLKVPEELEIKDMKHNLSLSTAVANIFSSYLDVSEIVPSFRELYYAGDNHDREMLILQEFEDVNIIKRAKEELNINEDIQGEFEEILTRLSGKPKSAFIDLINKIDFENMEKDYNAETIIKILERAGIDAEDYNNEVPSVVIDLEPYYKKEIRNKLPLYEDSYKITWYHRLENASLNDKLRLVDNFLLFDSSEIRTENSIHYDAEKEIVKQLEINEDFNRINLTDLYNNNYNQWIQMQKNPKFADEFIRNPDNMSLIYYREFEELSGRYNDFCKKFGQHEGENNMVDSPIEVVAFHVTTTPALKQISQKTKPKRMTGFGQKNSGRDLEKIGMRGEQLVYDYRKKDETKKLVRWVSENAKRAAENPEGGAGYGYDIEYVDSEGRRKYVEVKSAKSRKEAGIRFFMSDYEFEFGRKNAEDYLVYYVSDVKGEHPQILIFDNLFKNNDFNKKNFTLEVSNEYTISAQTEM